MSLPTKWSAVLPFAVCLVQMVGCALPPEPVHLPSEAGIDKSKGSQIAAAARKGGVPIAEPGAQLAEEPRIYRGTGEFVDPATQRPARPGSEAQRDAITLNLVNAGIAEAAKAVLGDVLKVNYVISDKVKASVTIQTSRPVSKDALIDIFEAVLKAEGIAIAVDNGVYRILPAGDAAVGAAMRTRGGGVRHGITNQVIPLQHVSAAEMERILRPVAPAGSILRVDAARNLMVLSGTRTELANLVETIAVFDVDWMRGMSFALIPLETSDPEAIAQELDVIFSNDRDGPAKGIVRFVPNRRLKSVLVISSRHEYIRKAEQWVSRIDMAAQASEKQVHVYHVQHRAAGELAQLLQRVYAAQEQGRPIATASTTARTSTTVITAANGSPAGGFTPDFAQPSPAAAAGSAVAAGASAAAGSGAAVAAGPPAPASSAAASADTASRPQSASGGLLDDRGLEARPGISVLADEANNALVITATTSEYKRLRRILERVDVMPNQVLLEATIAEVTLNDRLKFGVRWYFRAGNNQLKFADNSAGIVAPTFPGFSHFFNMPNVQAALDALGQITDVNVVSSPTLTVLDNKKAELRVGDEVPIAVQSAVSVVTPGAPIVNSIAFRPTGVLLAITPRIGDNGRILLDIEQEVSDVVPTTTSTLDSPTIQQRRVKTTVAVSDGEGLMLAGLMQDRNTRTRDQVPMLGDIPVVGNLFKMKNDTIKRTELLIVITPRIIKDAHRGMDIAREFRDRLNMTTRPQRAGPPDRRENWGRIAR